MLRKTTLPINSVFIASERHRLIDTMLTEHLPDIFLHTGRDGLALIVVVIIRGVADGIVNLRIDGILDTIWQVVIDMTEPPCHADGSDRPLILTLTCLWVNEIQVHAIHEPPV